MNIPGLARFITLEHARYKARVDATRKCIRVMMSFYRQQALTDLHLPVRD